METFHLTCRWLSVFPWLLLSFLSMTHHWTAARTLDLRHFEGTCHHYVMYEREVVYIQQSHSLYSDLDCTFILEADEENHYLEYLINDAIISMCDVEISIFHGLTMYIAQPQNRFNCKTKNQLPIRGRTTGDKLTFRIRKSSAKLSYIRFNMTVVTNKGPPSVLKEMYPLKAEYDICNPDTLVHNPATIYLPRPGYSTELYVKLLETTSILPKCVFVVKTCSQCQVRVEVLRPEFDFTSCLSGQGRFAFQESSGCPFFTFYDGDYKDKTLRTIMEPGGLGRSYSSETRNLYIEASRSFGAFKYVEKYDKDAATARFRVTSQLKVKIISRKINQGTSFLLTSPFFPDPCIQNGETYTFIIDNLWDDYFWITFEDWLLPPDAELKLSERSNYNVKGYNNRPTIYSREKREEMTFSTGTYSAPGTYFAYQGFKATITFSNESFTHPVSDCDQVADSYGGELRFGFVRDYQVRDCIWLVKKPADSPMQGIVLTSTDLGHGDPWFSVEIREGITSEGLLRYKFEPHPKHFNGSVLLSTKEEGFYIRLYGRFYARDDVVFHYAAFKYGCDPYSKDTFLCDNARCINMALRCDGVNHCGDNSDENKACNSDATDDSKTDSHVGMGIIIPLVVSLVVIIIICLFLVGLQRFYRLRRQQASASAASRPIAPRGAGDPRQRRRHARSHSLQMSVTVTSGELPPSYTEVMRSTPSSLSNVNVAFSFTPEDHPPSYREAVQAVDFDLSRSNSREDGNDATLPAYDSHTAETSFSNLAPLLPPYTINSHVNTTSNSNLPSNCSPGHIVFSVSSARSRETSFDPDEYVSSSSSAEYYDDDERGQFNRDPTYLSSDTSTDDDENGDILFAQALSLVSGHSSAQMLSDVAGPRVMPFGSNSNPVLGHGSDNNEDNNRTLTRKKNDSSKTRKEDGGRGGPKSGEASNECVESGRGNRQSRNVDNGGFVDESLSNSRNSCPERREERGGNEHSSRNNAGRGEERRTRPSDRPRRRMRNDGSNGHLPRNSTSDDNPYPERRIADSRDRPQRHSVVTSENEINGNSNNSSSSQARRDRDEGQGWNDGSSSTRNGRNENRDKQRNGAGSRNDERGESQGRNSSSSLPRIGRNENRDQQRNGAGLRNDGRDESRGRISSSSSTRIDRNENRDQQRNGAGSRNDGRDESRGRNDGPSLPRIGRNENRDQWRNGAGSWNDGGLGGNNDSTTTTTTTPSSATPQTMTDYSVPPGHDGDDGENSPAQSNPVPSLAQVLYKMSDENTDASFV